MNLTDIKKILRQYLVGKATSQEKASVDTWYKSFQEKDIRENDSAKEKVWTRIQTAINPRPALLELKWFRAAAAVALVAVSGGIVWVLTGEPTGQQQLAYVQYQTQTGEQKQITLSDGSSLILNSNTHVRVADDFTKTRRVEVTDGEVFFDVARDEHRPFIIQTGRLQTEVLGTSFSIQAYQQAEQVSINVMSGRVKVSDANAVLDILEKEQRLVFYKADSTFVTTVVPENAYAWKAGKIILEDASFKEMAITMRTQYGLVVQPCKKDVAHARYTASLKTTMKPHEALAVVAAIHGFTIQPKHDTVMLCQ